MAHTVYFLDSIYTNNYISHIQKHASVSTKDGVSTIHTDKGNVDVRFDVHNRYTPCVAGRMLIFVYDMLEPQQLYSRMDHLDHLREKGNANVLILAIDSDGNSHSRLGTFFLDSLKTSDKNNVLLRYIAGYFLNSEVELVSTNIRGLLRELLTIEFDMLDAIEKKEDLTSYRDRARDLINSVPNTGLTGLNKLLLDVLTRPISTL